MVNDMKNGFTLIELVVVITILAIIALISVPIVNGVITNSKESAYKEQEKAIVDAAKTYIAAHYYKLPKTGEEKCVPVSELKNEGMLKTDSIKNPVGAGYKDYTETSNSFDEGAVLITYVNNKYKYEYIGSDNVSSYPSCTSSADSEGGDDGSSSGGSSGGSSSGGSNCTYTYKNNCYSNKVAMTKCDIYEHVANSWCIIGVACGFSNISAAKASDYYNDNCSSVSSPKTCALPAVYGKERSVSGDPIGTISGYCYS